MQALYLHIKHEGGVSGHVLPVGEKLAEHLFVLPLDVGKLLPEGGVIPEGQQIPQALRVCDPALADGLGDEPRQPGVAGHQPAPVGDAVGDIGELPAHDPAIVAKGVLFDDLPVQAADPIDRIALGHAEVGHVHHVIGQDGHVGDAVPLSGEMVPQLFAQPAVKLLQDHVDAGQLALDQVFRPALQRF